MQTPNQIQDPWFKPKTIGWGWVPANTKGWLVILAFVIFTAINVSTCILLQEKGYKVLTKFVDNGGSSIIFYSTVQLVCNFILAIIALITITKLTSSTK
jgi:hypothetical protein